MQAAVITAFHPTWQERSLLIVTRRSGQAVVMTTTSISALAAEGRPVSLSRGARPLRGLVGGMTTDCRSDAERLPAHDTP
jgi:hypothetical protein